MSTTSLQKTEVWHFPINNICQDNRLPQLMHFLKKLHTQAEVKPSSKFPNHVGIHVPESAKTFVIRFISAFFSRR